MIDNDEILVSQTDGIVVSAGPVLVDENESLKNHFMWGYYLCIENNSNHKIQLVEEYSHCVIFCMYYLYKSLFGENTVDRKKSKKLMTSVCNAMPKGMMIAVISLVHSKLYPMARTLKQKGRAE